MQNKKNALAIVGPTAVGKTAIAIRVAQKIGGEIISCDSMQIYREMTIGTAKPTKEERAAVPHHLVDFLAPIDPYSAADYARDARRVAEEIFKRGNSPIFTGGTGLYLEAARTDRHKTLPVEQKKTEAIRSRLLSQGESEERKIALHQELSLVDPDEAKCIHYRNIRRVVRALEIYYATGIPKSEWDRRSRQNPPVLPMHIFLIDVHDRSLLYERIDARVDQMMEAGLLEETRSLYKAGIFRENVTAAQAIGYKELLSYLNGDTSKEAAVAALKTASRRYAKRQLTWFHAQKDCIPVYADEGGAWRSAESIAEEILKSQQCNEKLSYL